MNWDQYFISLLEPIAAKSKDPRTKVGCVIVGKNNEIKTSGFNGFPIGVIDSEERYNDRELKYKFVSHSETNAISFAARNGIALEGGKIYLTWWPCSTCTKLIIQAGLTKVLIDGKNYEEKLEHWKTWKEDMLVSVSMLNEAKVEVVIVR